MGFLSLLQTVGGAIARGASALFTPTAVRSVATIAAGTAAGVGLANLFGGQDVQEAGVPGSRTITIVATIDPQGNVIRRKTLKGSPWLMRSDFLIAKRVFKLIGKGNARLPRRVVAESKMKQFRSALEDNLLKQQLALSCPK